MHKDDAAAHGLHVRLRSAIPVSQDLVLHCAPGRVLALVGASGAGKTTTLRCIAGLHRPENGTVRCAGRTWLDTATGVNLPPHRRAAGLVFQDFALFPHMTALANVAAGMSHLRRRDRAPRARELLSLVRMDGMEDRRPAELSGGQQQRVALARALARDPDVLLLDEPFSAVDRPTRRALQADLAVLRRQLAIPMVLVTHDLDDALLLADTVVVLDGGRVLQHGPPSEVAQHPADARVAWLLGMEMPRPTLPARLSSWPTRAGTEPTRPARKGHWSFHRGFDPAWRRDLPMMKLSARNQIKGRVTAVVKGQTTGHVHIDIGNGVTVHASITNEAIDDLVLKVGDEAMAVIKSSDVMVAK